MTRALPALLAALCACSGGTNPAPQLAITVTAPLEVANGVVPTVTWTVVAGAARYDVHVDAALLGSTAGTAMQVGPLADGGVYAVEVRAVGPAGEDLGTSGVHRFVVRVPPASLPPLRLVRDDPARSTGGYKLFNLIPRLLPDDERVPAMVLVNGAGEIVWWYIHPGLGFLSDARVLPWGNLLFLVRVPQPEVTSAAYEATWDGTVVWRSRDGVLAHHEVGPGPDGGYLYLHWVFADHQGVSHEGDGLELVDPLTNDVLWSWNIFDHYDPADWQVPEVARQGISRRGVDWSHANAAVWDPDRSVIWVSIRHFDQIIGIDYPGGDVRIVLGRDGLGGPDLTSHQHAPEVQADGSLLFWDNGNTHDPQVSRARVVHFDEGPGTADVTWEWTDVPPLYNPAVGDADRQPNGNVLVTAGTTRQIIEVTPGGEKVWELVVEDDRFWIYRCEQVPDGLVPASVRGP